MTITLEGRCSWFGGPNDKGVGPKEGLALIPGLARALDPASFYIACRWDYEQTSKAYLQSITVDVCDPQHPDNIIKCRPVDWGPNKRTGRVADLSPGAIKALGLDTNDVVRVVIPMPGDAKIAAPAPALISTAGTKLVHQTWPLQRDCPAFYGSPSASGWLHANTVDVAVPWQMHMDSTPINHILIHKKCADSLTRVLNYVWEQVGKSQAKIADLHYDRFSGSYNFRPMRGGAALSMHSYAVAIDWDDADNQQHSQRHLFTDDSLLIKAFKAEGWEWGGDWDASSIDAMHIQAARVHGG